MTNIIELLEQYTRENPNTPILFDDAHNKGVTYAQLDDMSGRVYAYLKEHGIGKEAFVLLNLPRGILPVVAMIGVWKSGAAWALVEDTYAPDRIAFIRDRQVISFQQLHNKFLSVKHTVLSASETPWQ